jgi:hypothetical protein
MEIIEKLNGYFSSTEAVKEEMLIQVVELYRNDARLSLSVNSTMVQILDKDIEYFKEQENFEIAGALTDLKNAYQKIYDEMINEINNLDKDV